MADPRSSRPLLSLSSPFPNTSASLALLHHLQHIVVAASQAPGFQEALQCIVEQICTHNQWIFGEVWLPVPQGDRLVHSGIWYTPISALNSFGELSQTLSFARGEGLPGRVWASQEPEWITDVAAQPTSLFLRAEAALALNLGAGLGVPLKLDNQTLAVMVFFQGEAWEPNADQVEWVSAIATQVGAIVQLKRTESALRHSEQQYRLLAEQSRDLISRHNLRGIYSYVSPACRLLLGYEPEALLGRPAQELLHPEDEARVLPAYRQVLRQGGCSTVRFRMRHRQGHYRWFETVSCLLPRQSTHQRRQILALTRDVTDHVEVEQTLRDRERLMRLVLNSIPQQVFWKNTQGVYLGCNRMFAENAGLASPTDILGLTDNDIALYSPQEAAHFQHRDVQVMAAGEADLNVIESQPYADGSRRWVSVSKFPIYDSLGEVMGVMGTIEDISDRLAAQQALARREKYLAALVEVQRQLLTLDGTWNCDRYIAMLKILGQATLASRVYLYELLPDQDYLQQLAKWSGEGSEAILTDPAFTTLFVQGGPFEPWFQTLSSGGVINQTCKQFSTDLQKILAPPPAQVKSILLLPLMVKGALYGIVGFSNCVEDRLWSRSEVALLQVAAAAIALSIERYQAEVSLRRAETKYRSIFENAVEGIFQSTLEGSYLTVNPMLAQIYGYASPADLMASLTDIKTQLYVDAHRRDVFIRQMMKQGSVLGFESRVYRRDRSIIWISESARVVYDDRGHPISFEGTVEDITARKQAEVELHRRDRLLQGVAQASQHLLTAPEFELAVPQMLAILGAAADADRVYLYGNHPHTDTGEPAMSMRYEWTHTDIAPSIQQTHWQNQTYREHGLQRWYRTFLSGQSIRALSKHLPIAERTLLERDGILSILMVPIFIDQTLWGYVGFDACRQERYWTDNEESILVAISASLGGVLKRQQAETQMRHQAFHDALTGLPNRMLFNQYLPVAIAQAQRTHQQLAVMFLDLDRFKTINDTLGHAIGDLLLQQATQRLKQILREGDIIARWGGDEFTLILPNLKAPEEAAKIAQRLASLLRPAFLIEHQELYITSSIGIALYPQDGADMTSLLRHADAAMYRAKGAGRNTYRFYTATTNDEATHQLVLEKHLHHALDKQELHLFFQPQINLTTGQVVQVESLLRWENPRLGWVPPSQFISVAEEVGLIVEFGDWVLQTACAQLHTWHQQGFTPLRVAVNLSARQLQQRTLVSRIAELLHHYDLSPQSLELEITETAALLDIDASIATLNELRQLGTPIVMDDFGTGFSSLSYLKRLPIQGLKIDRTFVHEIPHNAQDVAMLRAIIALGQELGLMVVAEGVETQAQLDCLKDLGCRDMQGYWFSHPLAVAAMTQYLQRYWPGYDQGGTCPS
ncbi:EAL domain-containing protein [Leptolyngbya sp. PCC 6406]|uniref:EAL domain-containing protein n=1 Tax=Leptolyngbya sp. PCC 6406 TaxID=1173264 RepID=UPI0002AD0AA2|nr:EAL domain-containing protein [Leptolyngbya sp. PCC 6406]